MFVYVGPKLIENGIHMRVLRQNSAWFKDTLNTASIANVDQDELCDKRKGINLVDEGPAVFRRFNQWVFYAFTMLVLASPFQGLQLRKTKRHSSRRLLTDASTTPSEDECMTTDVTSKAAGKPRSTAASLAPKLSVSSPFRVKSRRDLQPLPCCLPYNKKSVGPDMYISNTTYNMHSVGAIMYISNTTHRSVK